MRGTENILGNVIRLVNQLDEVGLKEVDNLHFLEIAKRIASQEDVFPCCPRCGDGLEEIYFQEVLAHRCSGCQGMWLGQDALERITAHERRGWLSRFWRAVGH